MAGKTKKDLEKELKALEKKYQTSQDLIRSREQELESVAADRDGLKSKLNVASKTILELKAAEEHFRRRCTQAYALIGRLVLQLTEYTGLARILDAAPPHPDQYSAHIRVSAVHAPDEKRAGEKKGG